MHPTELTLILSHVLPGATRAEKQAVSVMRQTPDATGFIFVSQWQVIYRITINRKKEVV